MDVLNELVPGYLVPMGLSGLPLTPGEASLRYVKVTEVVVRIVANLNLDTFGLKRQH